jgi:hypothetical protein
VKKRFFWLFFGVCFWFGLWIWVCLVEVVVVGAFFQHGCGKKPIGCGSIYGACGAFEDFFKLVVQL